MTTPLTQDTQQASHLEQQLEQETVNTDSAKRSHIVNPPFNQHIGDFKMSIGAIIDTARIFGLELVALCGHKWVPTQDPEKLPICEACLEQASIISIENGNA